MIQYKGFDLVVDLHTHTLASVHAYSTIREMVNSAKDKGIKVLGTTDHGIGSDDSPKLSYFSSLYNLPKVIDGVRLLKGVEANIMDFDGSLDMPEKVLKKLDIVGASFHTNCIRGGSVEECTNAYLEVVKNPYVTFICHSGTPDFDYDYDRVIPAIRDAGKFIEINSHTYDCRVSSIDNCRAIAMACMKHQCPILLGSDAHDEFEIAHFDKALVMLEDIDFPVELVMNCNAYFINKLISKEG